VRERKRASERERERQIERERKIERERDRGKTLAVQEGRDVFEDVHVTQTRW
jgi:hypothetical protein